MTITIREILSEEMGVIFPFIKQLNKTMEETTFHILLKEMLSQGYRCAGAYNQEGKLVGIAGFWLLTRFWCGSHIDIDNVVVDESLRNQKIGKKLIEWLENWAKENNRPFAVLDSYVSNSSSHRFYFREGYTILGYHFVKNLESDLPE